MTAKNNGAPPAPSSTEADPDSRSWLPELRAFGEVAAASGRSPVFDGALLVASARRVAAVPVESPSLADALGREALGPNYFSAVGQLADELHALVTQAPDPGALEQLAPEAKAAATDVLRHLQQARKMVFTLAGATGRIDEAQALGRGLKVGQSLESIRTAARIFLHGAGERLQLLADAGVTAARLARLGGALEKLEALSAGAPLGPDERAVEIEILSLSLEAAFGFYRARAEGAFEEEPGALEAALRVLPRSPDRRGGGAPPKALA